MPLTTTLGAAFESVGPLTATTEAFTHGAMQGEDDHDSMMDWMGAWMMIWLLVGLLLVALILTAVVWLVRNMDGRSRGGGARSGSSALEDLDSSYARGQMSHEEYLQRRADLEDRR